VRAILDAFVMEGAIAEAWALSGDQRLKSISRTHARAANAA